ncbi:hypothetical protein Tco_1456851 [Tanacetum coccineum]
MLPAYLITAEVPEVYMHQLWNTIKKIKDTDAYRFMLDKQKFRIDTKIICISPREHLLLSSMSASLGSPQEDFMFQADNKEISFARKENMPYPRFTKFIISHFISKDKTISLRNRINLHTVCDDRLLGTLKFVSKTQDYQKYGALIPEEIINQAIKDSKEYKTYLAYATRAAIPKKARKFKKITSPLEKLTTVLEEELAQKPKRAKKPEPAKQAKTAKKTARTKKSSTMQIAGVVIRDTPGVSMSKKKTQSKVDRGKGMDLLSDGVDSESEVPNELKEKTTGTNKGTGTILGVPNVPKIQSESENESWGDSEDDDDSNDDDNENNSDDDEEEKQDDEYVHTPDYYVPTDEETNDEFKEFDEEECKELYGDVNINLKDVEPADKEKGDVEMTKTETGDFELENVNQEGVGNQVNDDDQATQKTEGPILSSSISSDYAAKYLNFDNIPIVDTKVVSMLGINVQHEFPRTSPLLTIPMSVILKHIVVNPPKIVKTASSATISSLLSSLFPHLQQITNLEKDVKELKIVDYSSALLSSIKYKVPKAVKEYLGTKRLRQQYVPKKNSKYIRKINIEHARKQKEPKAIITSSNTSALEEFDQKTTLFQTMTNLKSFNRSPKQRALYHALIELIRDDENAMDEGVADKLNKRKQDDADKDEGPFTRSDRGLKRQKTSKDLEPSKKAKSTKASKVTSKGTSKSQPKSTVKSAQADETMFEAGDTQEPHNQGQDMGDTDDQPNVKAALKHG